MQITLIAFGSRGDVAPIVALGHELRTHGHDVRLASHAEFRDLATTHGMAFTRVAGSYQEFLKTPEGRAALGIPRNSPLGCLGLFEPFRNVAAEAFANCWEATRDADALVCSGVATPVGTHIAARRDLPIAFAMVVPGVRTRNFVHPSMPPWPLGRYYKRWSHHLAMQLIKFGGRHVLDEWATAADRLGGAAAHAARGIVLVPVSPVLLPRPTDWPNEAHISGFWLLPNQLRAAPAPELERFVNAGSAPLAIGFGSMPEDRPDQLRAIIVEALEELDMRAVIIGGSGGAAAGFAGSDRTLEVAFADYEWLFARASAVVHQGGVGTACFALRAGVPQVVVPYCLDHAFWAAQLRALGVAPPPIGRHRLTSHAVVKAVRAVLAQEGYAAAAQHARDAIRKELPGVQVGARLAIAHFEAARR